jgi:Protein of unknown function (DUF3551)
MHKPYWLILVGSLLMLSPLHAQSGFSTLPYCAQYTDGSSLDCSFSNLSQCYQSVSGVGGVCVDNPTAGGTSSSAAAAAPQRPFGSPYAFAPAPVPPPPTQSSASPSSQGPVQLPGSPPQQTQAQTPTQPPPPCNPLYDGTYCASASNNALAPASSLASDLDGAWQPSATMGGETFSGETNCFGIFRPSSCGG